MNLEWVSGAVVVTGLVLGIVGLAAYGILDVARQYKEGGPRPPTASSWLMRFFVRHPFAAFLAGFIVGSLAGHFMWAQVSRLPCGL